MNRRRFVTSCTTGLAAVLSRRTRASQDAGQSIHLRLNPERVGPTIPRDFMGLGYEISSVSRPGLLSGDNHVLVRFVQRLGREGVIRIGGNTSDFATWSPKGEAISAPKQSVINQAVVEDLGRFLRSTGWKLIWGLNLGRGTPENAAEEAAAVASAAGDALLAFEIGNEPDLFARNGHRPANYGYPEFYNDFKRYLKVLRERVPNAPVAGPDVAGATDWVISFAHDQSRDTALLTQHYYAEGPPQNPASTIENLLRPNQRLEKMIEQLRETSISANVPYRIVEINSCFGGGKSGVSDTFASALWGLETMFDLGAAGAAGLNIEGGVNHLGWISKYSPIDNDERGDYLARPLYYGMLAFSLASRGHFVGVESDVAGTAFKAYAVLGNDGRLWLTLINKDASRQAEVTLVPPPSFASGDVIRLTAPSMDSTSHVTLGGPRSRVTVNGLQKNARA